jgi:hypothetical protein
VNMVLASSQYRTTGSFRVRPNVEPERGSVRRLHAICFEVESNRIRLLRLMPRRTVKSGTAKERQEQLLNRC